MKKIIVFSAICAAGILLPCLKQTATASSLIETQKIRKDITCTMYGYVLLAASEEKDGPIEKIIIYTGGQVYHQENCEKGYSCSVDVSGFPHGNYTAVVLATDATLSFNFSL